MAYRFDSYDDSLVISGFEKGIADDPSAGIADMRNVNIVSVPGEASVNFATSAISAPNSNGTMTNSSAAADTVTLDANPESGSAIQFSVLSDVTKGISLTTTYWAVGSSGTFQLYSDYALASLVNITGNGLTGTWATVNMGVPKYYAYASKEATPSYWMVDSLGQVWSNARTTSQAPFYWTFTGNKPNNNSNGNGLVYYCASNGTGYMFVFSNSSIDYTPTSNVAISWVYQWNWLAGTVGVWSATPGAVLRTSTGVNNSHEAFVAPDNHVYFCDSNYIGTFFQKDVTTPTAFVPTTLATYTATQTAVLPYNDTAQCLAPLGNNVLIGGRGNVIYPWDTFSQLSSYPILLPEFNVVKMVTINTTAYIFIGNRGRIYYTNGTNVQLYKKVPDHISGTIEPYFTWGGVCTTKNQIYFSMSVTTNAGVANTQYGGVWAVDTDTNALRLTNKLSYGTYAGYASAMIPNFTGNPSGTGLYIGWDSGASTYGIDTTSSSPYTGSQATIDTDLIPIGTYQAARDFTKVEYKLTKPLVAGESVVIKSRLVFDVQSTGYTALSNLSGTTGDYSGIGDINFKNAQWVQFQIILNSTASSPSYTRLREIRILGLTGPTMATDKVLGL